MTNSLLERADRLYEEDDYIGARDAYRQVFLETEPTLQQLNRLHFVEEQEALLFLRKLLLIYPDSTTLKEHLASYRSGKMSPGLNVDRYSDLLQSGDLDEEKKERIRLERFGDNLRSHPPDNELLFEDFTYFWNIAGDGVSQSQARRMVINLIAKNLFDISGVSFLARVLQGDIEEDVRRIISSKLETIRALQNYGDVSRNP